MIKGAAGDDRNRHRDRRAWNAIRLGVTRLLGLAWLLCGGPALPGATDYLFNDSHFHLTNYVQKGTDIHKYLEIMGDKIGRSTLFGIPLQQMWFEGNSGDFAPTSPRGRTRPIIYCTHE